MTEKQKVFEYIKSSYPNWVSGLKLEQIALSSFSAKSSTASRRARELVKSGNLERRLENKCVSYRYKPPQPKTEEQKKQESLDSLIQSII